MVLDLIHFLAVLMLLTVFLSAVKNNKKLTETKESVKKGNLRTRSRSIPGTLYGYRGQNAYLRTRSLLFGETLYMKTKDASKIIFASTGFS